MDVKIENMCSYSNDIELCSGPAFLFSTFFYSRRTHIWGMVIKSRVNRRKEMVTKMSTDDGTANDVSPATYESSIIYPVNGANAARDDISGGWIH